MKFAQMDSVRVEEIPWDVNRDQKYTIECEEEEYIDKLKDECWFKMHTSSCKGLDGQRKSGVCIGSLMCENKSCPKLLTEGIPNTNEFTKDSNVDVCKSCSYFVPRAPCGVLKLVEYDRDTKMMTVIYEGEHNCRPKPNLKKKFDILKDITKDTTCVRTPADVRWQVIKKLLAQGKISEAIAVTRKMDDTSLLKKMWYMSKDADTSKGQEDDIEAFRNLKTLKEDADKVDTNLIYAMNCGAINSGPTYVFKTSRYALETAVKMDATCKTVRGKASILSLEKVFFDGMHSRCKGYKTLTLWTHIFFRLFNEALANFLGEEGYKFNSTMLCMDKAGTNLQGVWNVFGDAFMSRVVSCQWHFMECARRQLPYIDVNDKTTFMHYVRMICKAQTFAKYKLYSDGLEHICRKNKRLHWYNWWKVRRYHLVPALRGFGWMGSNWAEIGHSMMKRHTKVWLSVAAVEDIADFIVQENNYLSFVSNTGKTIGKGPTSYAKKMKEHREQRRYIESVCDALLTTDMQGEVDKHMHPNSQFVPSCAAKHRVPKKFSTKNPMQKYKDRGLSTQEHTLPEEVSLDEEDESEADISSQSDNDEDYHPHLVGNGDTSDEADDIVPPAPEPDIPQCRVMPARKRRRKNRKYMSTTAAESSSEEEIRIGQKGQVKKDIEKKKMNTNPPTYVRIRPVIKRCQGCRVLFNKSERIPPNNLIFRYVIFILFGSFTCFHNADVKCNQK